MAMSKEKAIATVAKLLNLAENASANPNEAAVAAAQAQRIMEQHNLERASVDVERSGDLMSDESCECFDGHSSAHAPLWTGKKKITWRVELALGLCQLNDCSLVLTTGGVCAFLIIGRPSDVAVLRYVFTFVEREIDRLGKQAARKGIISGRTGGNNFRRAAVSEVLANVRKQKKEARREFVAEHGSVGKQAIIMLDAKALATKEAESKFFPKIKPGRATGSVADHNARAAGRQAGRNIAVRTGLNPGSLNKPKALKG